MKVILAVLAAFVLTLTLSSAARAQVAAPSSSVKCEGPADLCAQILDLRARVAEQQALAANVDARSSGKSAEALKEQEQKNSDRTMRLMAVAATMAATLKALMSALRGWKSYFHTDKGKAWVRAILLVVGFVAFVATNVGFGIPWWQALIVAGGGPGAILVHEMAKLIPVMRGKKPLPPEIVEADKKEEAEAAKADAEASKPS